MKLNLIGVGLSPFVRKTRAFLAEKGLSYDHEPMMPFGVSDEYKQKHPLGKVPCLEVDGTPVPDSSVICAYLERVQPEPSLYPADAEAFARALWFEEYADTGLANAIGPVFQERYIANMMKRDPDQARLEDALQNLLPPVLDYLEAQLGDAEYLAGGQMSIGDVAVTSQFVNLAHAGEKVDAGRWPNLAAYLQRISSRPSYKALLEEEQVSLS